MKIIQNLFIVIISFFIGLSLCEVLLRTAWPQFQILRGSLAAFHEELGYALVPGAQGSVRFFEFGSYNFKINGQGFRDSKVRENAFKILALGDSFTFGAAVDQEYTYPNQLELLLTSESNLIHVDVINGGVPSYNTRTELKYFEILSNSIDPDLVLVNILGNDILANLQSIDPELFKKLSKDKAPIKVGERRDSGLVPLPAPIKKFLQNKSHLYQLAARGFHNLLLNLGLKDRVCHGLAVLPETADVKSAWAVTKELLTEFRGLANSIGAVLIIVHIPQNIEALGEAGGGARNCDWQATSRNIEMIAESLGLPIISTVDAIKSKGGEDLFYWVDGHLTPKGYRVVAEVVATYLTQHDLIPLVDHLELRSLAD